MSSEEESKSTAPTGIPNDKESSSSASFSTDLPELKDSEADSQKDKNSSKSSIADNPIKNQNTSTSKESSLLENLKINPPSSSDLEEVNTRDAKPMIENNLPSEKQTSFKPAQEQSDVENPYFSSDPTGPTEEGGEWEELSGKLAAWLGTNQKRINWNQLVQTGLLIACFIGVLAILQIYGRFLNGIAQIPLAPRLFEFAGIVWLIRFCNTNLVRSVDRQELISGLASRWERFLGQSESDK